MYCLKRCIYSNNSHGLRTARNYSSSYTGKRAYVSI